MYVVSIQRLTCCPARMTPFRVSDLGTRPPGYSTWTPPPFHKAFEHPPIRRGLLDDVGWLLTPISSPFFAGPGNPRTIVDRFPRQQNCANKAYLCEIWKAEVEGGGSHAFLLCSSRHAGRMLESILPTSQAWGHGAVVTPAVASRSFLTEWQQQL